MNEHNEADKLIENYHKMLKNRNDFPAIANVLINLRLNNREEKELVGELQNLYTKSKIKETTKLGEIYLRGSLLARQVIRSIADRRRYPLRGVMNDDITYTFLAPFFDEVNEILKIDNSEITKVVYATLAETPLNAVDLYVSKILDSSWYVESIHILAQSPFAERAERAEEEAKKSSYKPDSLVQVVKSMTGKEVGLGDVSKSLHAKEVGAGPLSVIDGMMTYCKIRKELREDQIKEIDKSIFEAISTIESRYIKDLVKEDSKQKTLEEYYTDLSFTFIDYVGVKSREEFFEEIKNTFKDVPSRKGMSGYLSKKIVEHIKKNAGLH